MFRPLQFDTKGKNAGWALLASGGGPVSPAIKHKEARRAALCMQHL